MEEHRGSQLSPETGAHLQAGGAIQRTEALEAYRSPLRFLIITVVAIFLAEVVAMIAVYVIKPVPYSVVTLIDAGIMTLLIFPVLYYFSFRPLIRQMEKSWRAEESLLQSRELQEKFFDSIDTLIAYMDREFNFIRVNESYARADGRAPEYFIGKNHFELYPHPENRTIFQRVVETGEAYWVYERAFEYPDHPERGVTYWDWRLQPVKGVDGAVEGLVLSLINATERRRAQDLVHQFSSIVEQTEDSVLVTDCDGVIEYVNPAFERLTGYTREELLGKTPRVLKSGIHNQDFYRDLWGALLRGEVFQSEIANRKKNGELFYEVKTITPLRDGYGDITHFVATGKDITEHKLHEKKLQNAYLELEQRVQERTEELRLTNKELEEEIRVRRRTEESLRLSESGLKRAQEIAHVGNWELDLVANRLTWSDEVYRIFGLDPQEFQASYEAFLEIIHPDDRAAVDNAFHGSIRDGNAGYEIKHRLIRPTNGEIRIVHEKCEHFRNESGEVIRSVGMVHDITERERAEQALRRSEALLLQTGQMAKVGGWELDLRTMNLYWSRETYQIHEVDPSVQPDLESALDFYADEARPILRRAVQEATEEGDPYDLELPFVTAKGRALWIRTIGQAEFVEGKCVRLFGTFQDVTEPKQVEEELRLARDELEIRVQERTAELAVVNRNLLEEIAERKEVERRLRLQTTAMEAAANGIIITDHEGNIQWSNPALVQISGYESADLLGQSMRIFSSGRHGVDYYRRMWETILSGKVWRGEITNRRKDGSLYEEDQTITPVRDEQGQITQFIAIKQDITERKKAEAALRESEQKFRTLVEWTYDWEFWLDPDGRLVYTSPSCERITGFHPEEFIGDPELMVSIIHAKDRAAFLKHQQQVHAESSGLDSTEYRIITRDGKERWIEHICRPLFGAENQYLGRRVSNRDISERKQAEKLIRERNQKEKLLTQTIHTMQLDIARDLHDTLGQNIGFLRMKLDYLADKKIRRHAELQLELRNMARAANESYDLMRGTLAMLQSEDSADLFRLFTRYAEQIEERAAFAFHFTSRGEPRFMSAKRMRQLFYIFREILNNIEKHANATEVSMEMSWNEGSLKLCVSDNGIGFDAARVHYSSHYGLKFMRDRAELLNGSLTVQSAVGSGTRIQLQVPYE